MGTGTGPVRGWFGVASEPVSGCTGGVGRTLAAEWRLMHALPDHHGGEGGEEEEGERRGKENRRLRGRKKSTTSVHWQSLMFTAINYFFTAVFSEWDLGQIKTRPHSRKQDPAIW